MRPHQKWQQAKQKYALAEIDDVSLTVAAMTYRAALKVGWDRRSRDYLPTVEDLLVLPQALGRGYALKHADDPEALKRAMG